MSTTLHGKNFFGSRPVPAPHGRSFRAVDPARNAPIEPPFHESNEDDAAQACRLAESAAPEYAALPAERRAAFIESIAIGLEALGDRLLDRAAEETGLPKARLLGERLRTVSQLRAFAAMVREGSWVQATIDRALPQRQPIPKPDLRRMLAPLGPVVVFGASNFPLAFSVAGGDTASALGAGCPVVVKANRAHPGTSELAASAIAEAARETRMPEGVFSMLHGTSHDVGMALVRHPAVRAVGFTGSFRGGRALFDAACAREEPIPVFAEMGSTNPVFILPGALRANVAALAQGLAASVTLGVGQFCTNPGLVIAKEGAELRALRSELDSRFAATAPGTMLHRGIREAYHQGLRQALQVSGVTERARSSAAADPAKTQAGAALLEVGSDRFLESPALAEEVFGPSTLLVRCDGDHEILRVARSLRGHLTATIHGTPQDLEDFAELVAVLRAKVGRLIFNGFPTGVEVCPAMQHGGPYPATTDSRATSVGAYAIYRFARPLAFQNFPQTALPEELRDPNPRGIWRLIDNEWTRAPVAPLGA